MKRRRSLVLLGVVFAFWLGTASAYVPVSDTLVGSSPADAANEPVAYIGENGETYLLKPDGTSHLLTAYPTRAAGLGGVALDARAEVVATTRPDGIRSEVILVSVADGRVQAVPGSRERNCGAPSFLPDGAHLLVVCDPRQDYFVRSIDLFHRERGHVRTVVRGKTAGIEFVLHGSLVSPDGQWALVQEVLGDYAARYWRTDLNTGRVESFGLPGPEYSGHPAAFLPDGRILATSCELCGWLGPGSPPAPVRTDIVLLRPDGGTDAVLHAVEDLAFSPALSPDGEVLLYVTSSPSGSILWRVSRSTGEVRRVGFGEKPTYPQAAAPDGTGSRAGTGTPMGPPRGRQALAQYQLHPEAKLLGGDYTDSGPTRRGHIPASNVKHIGQDANRWEGQLYLGLNPEVQIIYGAGPNDLEHLRDSVLRESRGFSIRELAREADLSTGEVSTVLQGKAPPAHETLFGLLRAAARLRAVQKRTEQREWAVLDAVKQRVREGSLSRFAEQA